MELSAWVDRNRELVAIMLVTNCRVDLNGLWAGVAAAFAAVKASEHGILRFNVEPKKSSEEKKRGGNLSTKSLSPRNLFRRVKSREM